MKSWRRASPSGLARRRCWPQAARQSAVNYYNNANTSFFVPFVSQWPKCNKPRRFPPVSLTLNLGNSLKTSNFTMDTGSLGINAADGLPTRPGDVNLGSADHLLKQRHSAGERFTHHSDDQRQNGQTQPRGAILSSSGTAAQMGVASPARPQLQRHASSQPQPVPRLLTINGQRNNMNPATSLRQQRQSVRSTGVILGLTQANRATSRVVQLTPTARLPAAASCRMGLPVELEPGNATSRSAQTSKHQHAARQASLHDRVAADGESRPCMHERQRDAWLPEPRFRFPAGQSQPWVVYVLGRQHGSSTPQ